MLAPTVHPASRVLCSHRMLRVVGASPGSPKTGPPRVCCEHFMLIGAMNPCPCGYYGDPVQECTCSNAMVSRYQKRISGPLLDRIDIHIEVPRVEYEKLSDERLGEPSAAIRQRVEAARARQAARARLTARHGDADAGQCEPLPLQRRGRGRCGTTAGWTTRGRAC